MAGRPRLPLFVLAAALTANPPGAGGHAEPAAERRN
jgi:hypothetical protein